MRYLIATLFILGVSCANTCKPCKSKGPQVDPRTCLSKIFECDANHNCVCKEKK